MDLAFLSPLPHRPGPWASVYADTSHRTADAVRQQELQARAAGERLAAQGADAATCEAVRGALLRLDPAGARGHALFATAGEVVLDVPLNAVPPQSLTTWTVLPRLGPLLGLGGEEPTCLVAYVDRKGADLELRGPTARRPDALASVAGDKTWPLHRTGRDDWSERHFQLAVENNWAENATRIAATLAADMARTGAEVMVLAGEPRERRAVRERLPAAVREATVETRHGGRALGSDSPLLEADVVAARDAYVRRHAEEALDRFLAARGTEAAEGVPALVGAAREHRIAALLVRPGGGDLRRDVWVGAEPDQIAVRRGETHSLGVPRPAAARADDALLRSAAATGAEVVTLPPHDGGGPAEAPAGGLGALLRWAEPAR